MSDEGLAISVVAPCHNEVENVEPLVEEVRKVLEGIGRTWEIVLVDDGSTDGTWEAIGRCAARVPGVRGVRLARRSGQSAALMAALRAARAPTIVTMDADLQADPRDIPKLLAALEGADCATGDRTAARRAADGRLRFLSSGIGNRFRDALTGETVSDSACNFRAYRRECVALLRPFNGFHRFIPTLLRMEGLRVAEVPVAARPRLRGLSKYGVWNRLFRGLADVMGVRWLKSRHAGYEVAETTGAAPGGGPDRPAGR